MTMLYHTMFIIGFVKTNLLFLYMLVLDKESV